MTKVFLNGVKVTDRLTDPGTLLGRLAAKTPPGMAFFVNTGPANATCGECKHFLGTIKRSGIGKGKRQPGRCKEYIRLMKNAGFKTVPIYVLGPDTPACRYWNVNSNKPE